MEGRRAGRTTKKENQADPLCRVTGPRMNPSVDVGCPPRPFRHLRMAERRTPDLSSSRAPVHSALVQKSVTAITNPAGRLSIWMLGKSHALGKWKTANSWQPVCNQSNKRPAAGCRRLASGPESRTPILVSAARTSKIAFQAIVVYSGRKGRAPMSVEPRNPTPEVK